MPCPFRRCHEIRAVEEDDDIPFLSKRYFHNTGGVVENAENADHRRWVNGFAEGFVVEADVAAGDRRAKFGTGDSKAVDGFAELPHNVRFFRATEIEAIRRSNRACAGGGDVAGSFGDGVHRADAWI